MTDGSVVFTAVHMGPYQSMAPVELALAAPVLWAVDGLARRHRAERGEHFVDAPAIDAAGGVTAFLRASGARGLVRGTSDDVEGENLEDVLAAAATTLDLPVTVVEDYPGNFRGHLEGTDDALCVEMEAVAALHAARGVPPGQIHVTGNPRYDALRHVDVATRRAAVRARLGIEPGASVALWVGQPDAEDSYRTLEAVLPALGRAKATLLFRAHPRDGAYARGRYGPPLAEAGDVCDVTADPDVTGLCCAVDLVVTQFSSVAVEAGYLGTPALFVLLPSLGGAYIRTRKGYAIPPWCKENCAFLIDDAKMAAVVVDGAMHDMEAREAVRVNFARRYATRPPSAGAIARLITPSLEGSR